jgi:hypothetical protein
MSTPEARARLLFARIGSAPAQEETPEQRAARLFARIGMEPMEKEEDKNDLLQAGAGVLEGILDPLSVIPFVDRRLQQLEEYRGTSLGGKIGYGIGAIGGFMLPLAPANLTLRAGTATARGLKLVKSIDKNEDVVKLADKMVELSLAGEFVQGAVSGGLIGLGTGEGMIETESRALDTLQGAIFGGIADVALTPIWRAISGIGKTSKTLPGEVKDLAQKTLETGTKDNAPVIANERTAELIARSLTLADNVLGTGTDLEAKTELGLNIARSLKSIEAGELRVIPAVGRNHTEFVTALKNEGLDVIESTGPENVSSFLVGAQGTLSKELTAEFAHHGFVKGQSAVAMGMKDVKGIKGTVLGVGEKPGTVKMLFPGKKTRDVAKEDIYFLPSGYTKSVTKSIGKASSLWSEFDESYARSFSSDVLAREAEKLGIASGTPVEKPAMLSFDGAFEKFAREKNITGAQRAALKDYFVRRSEEDLSKFAKEEIEILAALRKENKGVHPEGSLVEQAALSGYKVVAVKREGKRVFIVRDVDNAQMAVFGTKAAAEAFAKNHRREIPDALKGIAVPVSDDILNTGGIAASVDEAGLEPQLSTEVIEDMGSSVTRTLGFIPREGYLRGVEDVATEAGESFPVYSGVFDPIARATVAWRNGGAEYMNMAKRLVGRWRRNIRRDRYDEWTQLMETENKDWARIAKELDLNDKEVKAATDARALFKEVWDKEALTDEIGLTPEQFITAYWPRMREISREAAEAGIKNKKDFNSFLAKTATERGLKVSEMQLGFFSDLHRMGHMTEYQTDPLAVMTKYIRGMTYKRYAKDAYDKADRVFNDLVNQYGNDKRLHPYLAATRDYVRLVKGQMPEDAGTFSNTFKTLFSKLGLSKYVDEATTDKIMTTYLGLNYAAFLGFRAAKAFINATQLSHVIMKDGVKYTGKGLVAAFAEGGAKWATDAGAIVKQSIRMPFEDQVRARTQGLTKTSTTIFGRAADIGLEVAEIGGKAFNKADEILRAVAFHSQRLRAEEAYNAYKGTARNKTFEEAAGLTAMGETVTQEYFKVLAKDGNEKAAEWLGVRAANDTQWMYQTGAGPIMFSRGAMKLFGQYGTWPAWYINWAKRGLTVGTKKDRALFAMRGAAVSGAWVATGYATGVSTERWHGPTAIFYSGGPLFDKLKNYSTIWGGFARPEGPPLEARLAMGRELGLKYDEDSPLNYTLDKPQNLVKNTIGLTTPGMLAGQDIMQAREEFQESGSLYRSFMIGIGFDMEDVDND